MTEDVSGFGIGFRFLMQFFNSRHFPPCFGSLDTITQNNQSAIDDEEEGGTAAAHQSGP